MIDTGTERLKIET